MFSIVLLIVLGTTIWMAIDAKTHRIAVDKRPYGLNNGALAWFLTALLLWIITFSYYLWKRSLAMNERRPSIAARPVAPIASPHGDGQEKNS